MSDLSNVSIDGVHQTWKQLYEREHQEVVRLQGFARMLNDLDRNTSGRHEGDVDGYDPTGVSQGNPHLSTGMVIGYSIAGWRRPYVVPEARLRGDLEAWIRTSDEPGDAA